MEDRIKGLGNPSRLEATSLTFPQCVTLHQLLVDSFLAILKYSLKWPACPEKMCHTAVGKVTPYLAYALLFLNLAVYGAGIGLALTQGNNASNEWFLSLAKVNEKVAGGEFYR